ncbi:MAG TPA: hypothetical protein VFU15_00505 [Bacteroidia bacterium]|nr:hypothetical protein [Bacteroidia bacterium]
MLFAHHRESYYQVTFPDTEFVDHLKFYAHAQKSNRDYYRAARLYRIDEVPADGRTVMQQTELSSTILSSFNSNEINLNSARVKKLLPVVKNEDDQPLVIDSVAGFQVKHYIVAELEKGNSYAIYFGDERMGFPAYDLRYFREKVPRQPPVIRAGKRNDTAKEKVSAGVLADTTPGSSRVKAKAIASSSATPWYENKLFTWIAIGTVILLLGIMTVRMLKEMG